ncbi:GNAT family N-acetyltransferase [Undibacterium pigrum]|uniref:RimJ/RimL family protein N-acetyltransferase n=1 Tax=Undibacterium pigrum TaxID=401470 RepID=A0A318JHZ1_9BURK|nr:GNAT family N-acetyltransferase [Undibacterium pigrum]PXX43278.1 RimJ/RimL family protein N-acetyltransferase [Undibacterium pigrum]
MQIKNSLEISHKDVSLRNIRRSDAQAWYDYLKNPDVIRHTSWNLHNAEDLLAQFSLYESDEMNSPIRLAIVSKEHDSLIGTVGFHTISDINRSAELAYDLAPEYWGKGVMQPAALALCDWGFRQAGYNRIQATVLETNSHSIQLLERMGFEREGYLRAFRMVRGTPGNFWMYACLHPDIA